MNEVYRTKSGRVLTDADIQALADEAEAGYDPEDLKREKRTYMAFSEQGNAFDQAFSRSEVEQKHAAMIAQGEDPEGFIWIESDHKGMPLATYGSEGWFESSQNR